MRKAEFRIQKSEFRIKSRSQKSGAGINESRISKCGFSLIFWLLTPGFWILFSDS
jgi:hypothetical protein